MRSLRLLALQLACLYTSLLMIGFLTGEAREVGVVRRALVRIRVPSVRNCKHVTLHFKMDELGPLTILNSFNNLCPRCHPKRPLKTLTMTSR